MVIRKQMTAVIPTAKITTSVLWKEAIAPRRYAIERVKIVSSIRLVGYFLRAELQQIRLK